MAIKRYTADADNTITNAYKANLTERGVSGNMGQSDIVESFSIYAQESASSTEYARILIKFPVTGTAVDYISYDRTQGNVPASGSVSFYLRMFNARHSQTTPKDFNLIVSAISQSWQEGNGLDMENYSDEEPSNWLYTTDTDIAASASITVRANTAANTLHLTGAAANYLFTSINDATPAPDFFHIGGSTAACATNIVTIINTSASADFSANAVSSIVYITSSAAGAAGNLNSISSSAAAVFDVTGSDSVANSGLSGTLAGGSDYTLWTTEGGDYYSDASSSFTASFNTGFEDLELDITPLVEQWINSAGNVLGSKSNYGVGVKLSSTEESDSVSYYTKKFFARGSQYFFYRPIIEARWDSSIKDDRGSFYYSSSLAPAADNLNTIYYYNYVRGQLKNIPAVGTGSILVSLYSGSSANTAPSASKLALSVGGGVVTSADYNVTGGYVSTGIYSASFAFTGSTSLTTVYDVWHSSSIEYYTGSIEPKSLTQVWPGQSFNPNQQFVSNITNLKPSYSNQNTKARFRLYTRKKDWSPTIYTVSSKKAPIDLVEDIYYKLYRVNDDLEVISYGTGSANYTRLSFDKSGSYFDLDMSLLKSDDVYAIKFVYYLNSQYVEQSEEYKFRVE